MALRVLNLEEFHGFNSAVVMWCFMLWLIQAGCTDSFLLSFDLPAGCCFDVVPECQCECKHSNVRISQMPVIREVLMAKRRGKEAYARFCCAPGLLGYVIALITGGKDTACFGGAFKWGPSRSHMRSSRHASIACKAVPSPLHRHVVIFYTVAAT